ncbi:hypothetical protein [Xanthocytophaga agilis]|uniref:Uncharacterized protein n=1 Tax=Xanthocytophaga agilis TaxID=3048010 RepID=A0AAE3R4D8_9BACT|nr:hypothetical protein [Xanthocytophaga agilis]MDJ1500648.1 hypothetical protein [Xanthocytophaga agilis]
MTEARKQFEEEISINYQNWQTDFEKFARFTFGNLDDEIIYNNYLDAISSVLITLSKQTEHKPVPSYKDYLFIVFRNNLFDHFKKSKRLGFELKDDLSGYDNYYSYDPQAEMDEYVLAEEFDVKVESRLDEVLELLSDHGRDGYAESFVALVEVLPNFNALNWQQRQVHDKFLKNLNRYISVAEYKKQYGKMPGRFFFKKENEKEKWEKELRKEKREQTSTERRVKAEERKKRIELKKKNAEKRTEERKIRQLKQVEETERLKQEQIINKETRLKKKGELKRIIDKEVKEERKRLSQIKSEENKKRIIELKEKNQQEKAERLREKLQQIKIKQELKEKRNRLQEEKREARLEVQTKRAEIKKIKEQLREKAKVELLRKKDEKTECILARKAERDLEIRQRKEEKERLKLAIQLAKTEKAALLAQQRKEHSELLREEKRAEREIAAKLKKEQTRLKSKRLVNRSTNNLSAKVIVKYNINTNEIVKLYSSQLSAAKENNCHISAIVRYLDGSCTGIKSGFSYRYATESEMVEYQIFPSSTKRKVEQYNRETGQIIKRYDSLKEAAIDNNMSIQLIHHSISNGKRGEIGYRYATEEVNKIFE